MESYIRVPLSVEAVFAEDGSVRPTKIYFDDEAFSIIKILSVRSFCPVGVACIAPVEFTVMIDRSKKKVYYERDTNTWFSVKVRKDQIV